MNTQAPSPQPPSDDASRAASDFARPVLEEQLAGLRQLARIGLAIAGDIERVSAEVTAARNANAGADAANTPAAPPIRPNNVIDLAIARVSRAVRLTYAMQNEVLEQLRRVGHIEEAHAIGAKRERAELSQARRGTAARVLTRIIQDEVFGSDDADAEAGSQIAPESDDTADSDLSDEAERETYERLVAEASECLRDRERFGDVAGRPISDIVALICRDLGIDADWLSLSDESWAREELRSGLVGAALATLPAGATGQGPRRRRIRKPIPLKRPSAAKPPPIETRANAALPDEPPPIRPPIDAETSDAIASPATPPTLAPPPIPTWRRRQEEDEIAQRFALPGELPPLRRPRPRGRSPTY